MTAVDDITRAPGTLHTHEVQRKLFSGLFDYLDV